MTPRRLYIGLVAVIVLAVAVAGGLTWLARRKAHSAEKAIGHEKVIDAEERGRSEQDRNRLRDIEKALKALEPESASVGGRSPEQVLEELRRRGQVTE